MPRLFISHSSKDNIAALAFQRWLMGKGWGEDDVFIDLHDMQAGEKWRETLVKANVACDALLFLASPEALGSGGLLAPTHAVEGRWERREMQWPSSVQKPTENSPYFGRHGRSPGSANGTHPRNSSAFGSVPGSRI